MKITLVAFILLFAFTTKPLLGAAGVLLPEQVLDTSGKVLRAGAKYYVVPAYGDFDGLSLTSRDNQCPMYVVAVEGYSGQPLLFTPLNPKTGVVRVSTDLNIAFSAHTDCPQSNVWKLDNYDATTGQWFVTTGGVIGNPGWHTVSNWFKIEKYEDSYKLMYCPTVCSYCTVQCRDVGVYLDSDGNERLALTDSPYQIFFKKA